MITFRLQQKLCFRILAVTAFFLALRPVTTDAAATTQPPQAAGRRPLRSVARFYGFPHVYTDAEMFTMRSEYSRMMFAANSRRLTFNDVLIHLNGPVGGAQDRWRIDGIDAEMTLDALLRPSHVMPEQPVRVVVIDPGHGGDDPGGVGKRGLTEKEVVLDIARRVRSKLQTSALTVHLTRDDDEFLSLNERVEIANSLNADLFVSIHANAVANPLVSGVETFVLPAAGYPSTNGNQPRYGAEALPGNRFDAANTLLGYFLQQELLGTAGTIDRGVKRSRFVVLKNIQCPAALVECGFISNPQEEERFMQTEYRDQLAEAIARGILRFVERAR